jgi:tetratricopeptide (TPR) repeat protein
MSNQPGTTIARNKSLLAALLISVILWFLHANLSEGQSPDPKLPDLIITDIYCDGNSALITKYMNVGAAGAGDFTIKYSANGNSYPGNSLYRFKVPEPGQEMTTGRLTIGLIGLKPGMTAIVTAEIDWENRVNESNKNNNVFHKQITIPSTPATSASKSPATAPPSSTAKSPVATPGPSVKKVVDVDFNPGGKSAVNAVFSGNDQNQEWAQTFTVGAAGVLTEIDVFVKHYVPSRGSLQMELRRANAAGIPASSSNGALCSVDAETASVPQGDDGFVAFDVSSRNIRVSPGEKYAIVLRAGEGASTFKWLGLTGNLYTGGGAFDRQSYDGNWSAEDGCDLGIRTFVTGLTANEALKPNAPLPANATAAQPENMIAGSQKAVWLDLNGSEIVYNSDIVRDMKENVDKTISDMDAAIRLNAQDAMAYYYRGIAYYLKNNFNRGVADESEAIRYAPTFAPAYNARAIGYDRIGYGSRAVSDFNESIRLNPKDAAAFYNRGTYYVKNNNLQQALADFDEAVRLDPRFAPAYNGRAMVYGKMNQPDKAQADLQTAKQLSVQSP